MKRFVRLSVGSVFVALLIAASNGFLEPSAKVTAASASDWQAGRIIEDALFYNGNDMTVDQIQAYLNQKVPVCDTWGTQTSEYGGGTRAQYGTSRGYPAPFICLKDYYENPMTHDNNLTVAAGQLKAVPAGAMSAAQIIKYASSTYNVSARALIVLLHKESPGPLTVDTWPFPRQYRNAMGYGCPDTAPCDANYAGFYNQVVNAAKQFSLYKQYPTKYRHSAGHYNSVLYNPSSSCGASLVFIHNDATAGLYNYTPYQPNQAALDNLYSTGDSCSSYGNRNFWRVYTDWFGSTAAPITCTGDEEQLPYVVRYYNPRTYMHFYTAYSCDDTFLKWIGYKREGPVFNTSPKGSAQAVPVYRYYNPDTGLHFWTTTKETAESLAASGTGYKMEVGVVFYVADSAIPGLHNVYRLYNPKTYLHIWASDPTPEDLDFLANKAGFTVNEGPAFSAQ